jgi:tRNA pseudouridine55 synthase
LARAGEEVEMPEREVLVTEFRQDWRRGELAGFSIACGSGTYVRSLIADLGDAYCQELRRTEIGPFRLSEAGPVPLGLADALARVVPVVTLPDDAAVSLGHGRRVPFESPLTGEVLCVDPAGDPAALAQRVDGALVSTVGFRA